MYALHQSLKNRFVFLCLCLVIYTPCCDFDTYSLDICSPSLDGKVTTVTIPHESTVIQIRYHESVIGGLPENSNLVLIANGNGYRFGDYVDLTEFLALNGFITVVSIPGEGSSTPEFHINSIRLVFEELGLPDNTSVALIGHSAGGGEVLTVAIQNQGLEEQLNIVGIVGLAPTYSNLDELDAISQSNAGAYLGIYGSQDEDVEGDSNPPSEVFVAFDLAGNEGTSTCADPPCMPAFSADQLEKFVIYIHGAGHSGIINREFPFFHDTDPISYYLSVEDQFCIAKGYINAFLRWKIQEDSDSRRALYRTAIPSQIAGMTTIAPDYKSDDDPNPAGSNINLSFSFSAKARMVIENFQDEDYNIRYITPTLEDQLQLVSPGEFHEFPFNVRHQTHFLLAWWRQRPAIQRLQFQVPDWADNANTFTHLSIRLGQLANVLNEELANPEKSNQNVMICIDDGSVNPCRYLNELFGSIPAVDPQPDGMVHSVMSSFLIPLNAFEGLDKSNIEGVEIRFLANTQGTIMIDNIEWVRNPY